MNAISKTLVENAIKRTIEYKHLGIWLDEKVYERIAKANQWFGWLGNVAKCMANKYEVVRRLWKGMAVLSIMY